MCFICDGGTEDELRLKTEADIDTIGWHVVGVETGQRGFDWVYTIGLGERFDHPELVVNGTCCFSCAHRALNALGTAISEGRQFKVGDAYTPPGALRPVERLSAVHPRHWQTSLFAAWLDYYDGKPWAPPARALQVISLSQSGRWQDDPDNRRWKRLRLDRPPHISGSRSRGR